MNKLFALTFASVLLPLFAPANTGSFTVQQGNFKDLYNSVRVAQPEVVPWAGSFFPYRQQGTALKLGKDGNPNAQGRSPMEVYEKMVGATGADEWEKQNHSCDVLKSPAKESCESWWGHCNGWSGAAVKDREPRKEIRVGSEILGVADQKAILSELWLNTYSVFAGESDKSIKTAAWIHDHANPTPQYRRFWDVTPRSFFTVFTNTIGLMKMGVVIDRHTGDEVWNQPVVGYRILPLRPADIRQVTDRGVTYWSVFVRTKIYWANDLGTPPGHVSAPFDIFRLTRDEEALEQMPQSGIAADYEGRILRFRLMFDGPVKISADGLQVLEAGQMIGDGIWDHQENSQKYGFNDLNRMHPDFIWLPTNPMIESNGYGNPFVTMAGASALRNPQAARPNTRPAPAPGVIPGPPGPLKSIKLVMDPKSFPPNSLKADLIKGQLKYIFRREGIRHTINANEITIRPDRVIVPVVFPDGLDRDAVSSLFRSARYSVNFEL